MLLEAMNVAGSWGPLAGKVKPMTGGTRLDVALYVTLRISVAVSLFSPGAQ